MRIIRPCRDDELTTILDIVNSAAVAYRGVIPADRWHDPYMSQPELRREIEAGVVFFCLEIDGELAGVMGIQPVLDVDLIRHAYVLPRHQRLGVGAELLGQIGRQSKRPMLVGTWAAASWAIGFYQRHGFELVPGERKRELLEKYWNIPDAQVAASVVLAKPPPDTLANS